MLPIPLDIILTAVQHFFLLLLVSTTVNYKIGYKKILVIAAVAAVFNVCIFTPFFNIWLKMMLTIVTTVLLIHVFTKLPVLFSVIVVLFDYIFAALSESAFLTIYFSYISKIPSDFLSDVFINTLTTVFMCTICLVFTLILKQVNFQILNFDSFMRTYLSKFKPIFLLIILIQIVPLSFYSLNIGVMLYGSEILQNSHIDQMLSLVRVLNIFFITLALIMLYLINLVDKNMIKKVTSILRGECITLHEDDVHAKLQEKEVLLQQISLINKQLQRKQYREVLFELNKMKSYLNVKELFAIQIPHLRSFLQNRVQVAQLAEIDFILEVDEDLSGLEYYVDDFLLEMLQELYNNAFGAALEAEFSEVYSKFIREENGFVILINNNGIILPPTHQAHLFDPNYTNKNELIHGQGLFKVKKLIDYYEGSIDIRGYDDYTRVTVKLPMLINNSIPLRKVQDSKYTGLRLVKNKEVEKI